MDDEGLPEAVRAIRSYLPELVGPDADALDRPIADLLAAAGRGEKVSAALWSLLDSDEATRAFATKVLADAPQYRPPDLQPDDLRGPGMQPLPGDVGPVRHAGSYSCSHGDYVWYPNPSRLREQRGSRILLGP